jgi:GMP synthase-like glutamine amidotransferase
MLSKIRPQPSLTFSQHIHQMHRDVVWEYPHNVERLGSSPLCDVQGMYIKNHMIAVQGHPEFNEAIETELLERRHAQGIFADAAFDEAMKRVSRPHDGVVVAAAFLQFLLEE